jgi:hypothetical protein
MNGEIARLKWFEAFMRGRCLFLLLTSSHRAAVAHVCESEHDNGRATPDGVKVVAAFAVVLVCLGLGLLLRCELLVLCTCLTYTASSLILSSAMDE